MLFGQICLVVSGYLVSKLVVYGLAPFPLFFGMLVWAFLWALYAYSRFIRFRPDFFCVVLCVFFGWFFLFFFLLFLLGGVLFRLP